MTVTESTNANLTEQQLGQLMQYTAEAYKTFQKLAESLPNPLTATMFKQFAVDERENRDLLEMKIAATAGTRVRTTLGPDLLLQDILEGDLSDRATAEFLISRERTMQRKLRELQGSSAVGDRLVLVYLEAVKRSHIVELERELELIKLDSDWLRREDAEWRLVHGTGQ